MRKTLHLRLAVLQLPHTLRPRGRRTLRRNRAPGILAGVLALSLAAAFAVRFLHGENPEARRTFPALGTFATVVVRAPEEDIPGMMSAADSLLNHIDCELGRFSDTGQLRHLNTAGSISSESELGRLARFSNTMVAATGGSFDPSLGALVEVWGFPGADSVPDPARINEALTVTGWEDMVTITEDSILLHSGGLLDFGAVAKGWAVDRTWTLLMEMGAEECLVEVGGEVRCGSSTGRVWNIGVRHPRNDSLAGVVSITEGAVATSGDYECFFIENGVRYSHLLDRNTGYPSGAAAGATVVAPDCATADAMATAAAVGGPDAAGSFPEELYTGIIVIVEDGQGACQVHRFGEVPWAAE